jgi:multisubunit Na+/H+ antiporter MnhE subunit
MEAHRSRSSPLGGMTKFAGSWLAWWAALAVVWLLLVDTLDSEELLVGAVAASIAATVAVAVHRRGYIRFWPRAVWLLETPYVVRDVIVDCGRLAGALWRRLVGDKQVHGDTIRVPFHHGGDNGRDGARRALVNFAVSLTPNTYVVDIDPESDSLLIHQLVPDALDRVLLREQKRAASTSPNDDQGDGS